MKKILIVFIFSLFLILCSCSFLFDSEEEATGAIPTGMPKTLSIGLFEEKTHTWMADSKIPWSIRYCYLVDEWINNWGWDTSATGTYAYEFMTQSDAIGAIPAFQFYRINTLAPKYDETAFYTKIKDSDLMRKYFSEFKTLLIRAKEFNKPVIIMVEADGFAFLQKQCTSNPAAVAAIKSTLLPELASLGNTVADWGLAFLALKKATGATNVILGMHVSAWAGSTDIVYSGASLPLQSEVDSVYSFLSKLGLSSNVTGLTWDLLITDPLDRDSDYYLKIKNDNRWWNANDNATITEKSFNRYAEWLKLWNIKSGKKWILWQIPCGNQWSLNISNTAALPPKAGWKDNRAEYFLGATGEAHRKKFVASGVIALLFGRGSEEQASYTNDQDAQGNLYIKTNAGAYLRGSKTPLN